MAGNDFINQYLKRFSEAVQANEEATAEFRRKIETENAVPIKLALELLRKYSGDMNSFFQAVQLKDIKEGYSGNILGTVSSIRCIEYDRDGNKKIRCVGTLEDKTGKLSFTEFPESTSKLSRGDFVLIVNAQVGSYNGHPYLTISSKTEINVLEKSSFKSVMGETLKVRDLKPDMYDVTIRGSLRATRSKENIGKDSVTLYSGILNDDSGNVSIQSWGTPLTDGIVEITGASVKQFKEKLYLQIGKGTKINVVSEENGQFENLEQLINSQSGTVKGSGIVLKIIDKNIIVSVCSVCQKVLKDERCQNHPEAPAERILRLSMVIDDGYYSPLVYVYQKALEELVTGGKNRIKEAISSGKELDILEELKNKIIMKPVKFVVYGFRGSAGTYMEAQELFVLDDIALGEEYQKTIEVLK
ncbi:MAG: hypothetical protein QXU18_14205 [Thermoplasmatales archaeon]